MTQWEAAVLLILGVACVVLLSFCAWELHIIAIRPASAAVADRHNDALLTQVDHNVFAIGLRECAAFK